MNIPRFEAISLCVATLSACVGAPDTANESSADTTSDLSESFTGTLSANGTSWRTHTLTVSGAGELTLSLDWAQASADFNLFLSDSEGNAIAHQNGSARPEVLTLDIAEAGTYVVGVKCKTGSSAYTLNSEFVPTAVEHVFTGTASSAQSSWLSHTFDVASGQAIRAELGWVVAQADLNVFLYDPTGTLVDFSNSTTDKPEIVEAVANRSGAWRVSIKAKSGGSTAYDLKVRVGDATSPEPASYPGQPAPGTLAWGASVTTNGDPVTRHENAAGHPLTLRRTFYQWDQRTTKMITIATGDLGAGRLPWVSVKPPSWAAMGAGQYDGEIDQMLQALDGIDGPVWLTVHHEPEGGGGVNSPDDPAGPAGHVAMNRRVRARMTALGVDNVALAPILMSYTWKAASGRDPQQWWAPGIYDFLGVDHYQDKEVSMLDATWFDVRAFAEEKGVDVAVGEWGMRGTNAAAGIRMKEFYDHAANSHADGGGRVVGLSYFDSGANSPTGSWELAGAQLTMFRTLLTDPRTADPR